MFRLLEPLGISPAEASELLPTISESASGASSRLTVALAWHSQGQFDLAIAELEAALRLSPRFAAAHILLGNVLTAVGRFDDAIGRLRQGLELSPSQKWAWVLLAKALAERQRIEEAIDACRAAIEADPTFEPALTTLGGLYFERERYDEAAETYSAAVRSNPQLAIARRRLAAIYAARGEHERANDQWLLLLKLQPYNADARVMLGDRYVAAGQYDLALVEYRAAVELWPSMGLAHYKIGDVFLAQGHRQQAMVEYQAALRLNCEVADCHHQLGRIYLAEGAVEPAIAELEAAIAAEPSRTAALRDLAHALRAAGRGDEADAAEERARGLDPDRSGEMAEAGAPSPKATPSSEEPMSKEQPAGEMPGAGRVEPDAGSVVTHYDNIMYDPDFIEYFGGSDLFNFGYWGPDTRDQREASVNLVERLLALIPEKRGTILDVACGKGGSTGIVARHYQPEALTGINISEKQLATARESLPRSTFLCMDAARMTFPDASFDAVICVEAAFHFNTREEFLRHAYRVLRPGGRLALSDILMTRSGEEQRVRRSVANFLADGEAYAALCHRIGFTEMTVIDATEECWRNLYRYLVRSFHERFLRQEISRADLARALEATYGRVADVESYLLLAATKPRAA